jgi:hypothetical protein
VTTPHPWIEEAAAAAARRAGYCWQIHPGEIRECTRPRGHENDAPDALGYEPPLPLPRRWRRL